MQKEFTTQAENVLIVARKMAKKWNHPYVGTEHVLLALRKEYTGVAGQVLAMHRIEEEEIEKVIVELVSPVEGIKRGKIPFSPRLEFLLDNALLEAVHQNSERIGTEHMLLAMMKDGDSVATRILATLNADLVKIRGDIFDAVGIEDREEASATSSGMMEQFATDLTLKAVEGKLDPVVGRKEEIERLMQVLSRRSKNNPCLIGEPGVGKTAIIEGLAIRIAEGLVPDIMKDKRIFTLDLSAMVAGTKYRGEFEERMKKLLREVKADKNIVLFLDEIHTMIGAGGSEGALDAANILKPAMSRGEIQLIGATTISEYRKHIEKDAALERRFQPIVVEEPNRELCLQILEGLKERYELHHRVNITEEALRAAVDLSQRYVQDRYLPDKAIDVLDEACSKVSLRGYQVPVQLDQLEKTLKEMSDRKEEEIKAGNFAEASLIHQEQGEIGKKIERMKKRFHAKKGQQELFVEEEDVAVVISSWTKIPVQKLTESESGRLKRLEETIHKRVIGQEEAVTAVAKAVKRGRVGIKSPNRPVGSFLFLGPTGVGKTELCKALAEAMFGSENSLIRVDMSEYMESHSVSNMIGSPPGYVGFDEGGQLSEKIRRNPYSVVLFDEIEKAHPDVFNILLQVLDDGHITDSKGRKVSFKNSVIIMTSNAGASRIIDPKNLGFAQKKDAEKDYERMKDGVMEEVKRLFKPEFINRIDKLIVFHPLQKEDMKEIMTLLSKDLISRCKSLMNIQLTITPAVKNAIVDKYTNEKMGARPLKRAIQSEIEDALAEEILAKRVNAGDAVVVRYKDKKVVFETKTL